MGHDWHAGAVTNGDPTDGTRLIRALRLRNQGLVPGRRTWADPAAVAKGMLAMQGQDFAGVKLALSVRCSPADEQPEEDQVQASFATGTVVRNRPSRGTLQVTAPEDLGWMTRLMSPRSIAAAAKRRDQLGVTDRMLDGVEEVLRAELANGAVLSRKELQARLSKAGLPGAGPQASHLLGHHTQVMTIVYAAPDGKAATYALADDWIANARDPGHDQALGELATRYFDGHGPATVKDFAWWSNLTMGETRRAIELAGSALEQIEIDDVEYLVSAGTTELTSKQIDDALAAPLLLPPFDEYLLGYTASRSTVLHPVLASEINPGANGMFKAVIVVAGEVVGTWQRSLKAKSVDIDVRPFEGLTASAERGLLQRADDVAAYLGKAAAVTIS